MQCSCVAACALKYLLVAAPMHARGRHAHMAEELPARAQRLRADLLLHRLRHLQLCASRSCGYVFVSWARRAVS
jgi:hypothetical protein